MLFRSVLPPSPTSSDDELDLLGSGHQDVLECTLDAMIAGIEHVYSGEHEDFLSYDEALDFAFNSVVQHALKAVQEHFGEPRSSFEVHKLPKVLSSNLFWIYPNLFEAPMPCTSLSPSFFRSIFYPTDYLSPQMLQ